MNNIPNQTISVKDISSYRPHLKDLSGLFNYSSFQNALTQTMLVATINVYSVPCCISFKLCICDDFQFDNDRLLAS